MSIVAPPHPSCSKTHFRYERGFFYKIRYGFWNSELVFIQGDPTTVFSEISEFSIAWGRLEISTWPFQLCTIFEAYPIKSPQLSQDAVLAVFWVISFSFSIRFCFIFLFSQLCSQRAIKIYSLKGIFLLWSASPFVCDINLIYFSCDDIDSFGRNWRYPYIAPRVFAKRRREE